MTVSGKLVISRILKREKLQQQKSTIGGEKKWEV